MVGHAVREWGHIDILVNNAGIALSVPTAEMSERQWDQVLGVNLKGVFLCSKAVGKVMIEQKRGKIINIASFSAYRGIPGLAAYCVSKAGVIALTRVACPQANIPVTAALATVNSYGYERALHCGANVIMISCTPLKYKRVYDIYPSAVRSVRANKQLKYISQLLDDIGRKPGRWYDGRTRSDACDND